jgi:hypothetical protein
LYGSRLEDEILIFSALLATTLMLSMLNSVVYASTDEQPSAEVVPESKAVGRGWIVFYGRRESFAFNVYGGILRSAYGWRYLPLGRLLSLSGT